MWSIHKTCPTSYMNMSKMRVATGRGRKVRNRVRNQDEAYMDVWKLWERKWTFSSGSCSWGDKQQNLKPQIIKKNNKTDLTGLSEREVMCWRWILIFCCGLVDKYCTTTVLLYSTLLPVADTQTGKCRGRALPCWVWTVPLVGTPAWDAQKHKTPPPLASEWRQEA